MLRITQKQLRAGAKYGGFFIFMMLVFSYFTFPYERLRDYIIQTVEMPADAQGNRQPTGYKLEIDELEPTWWLIGLKFSGVRFTKPPVNPSGKPLVIHLDEFTARPSILGLIWGALGFSFSADVGDGSIDGSFKDSSDETQIETELDEVDLNQLFPKGLSGLPVRGTATGEVDLTIANEAKNTEGSVDLVVNKLIIGDGKSEVFIQAIGIGLAMDKTNTGDFRLAATVQNGVAQITQLSANGTDLKLAGSGNIRFARPVQGSATDILVRFMFTENYRKQHEWVNGLYSMADFNPMLKAAKTSDGALQFRLQGTFGGALQASPAGTAPRPKG